MGFIEENLNTIILGDCLEVMKQLPDKSIDLVLTDPPYILDLNGGTKGGNFKRKLNCEKHINFISNDFDYKSTFSLFLQKCKIPNILVFCSNSQISRTMDYFEQKNIPTTLLVWQKPNPIPFANGKFISDCEFIVSVRGKGSYFNNSLNIKDKSKVIRMPSSDNYYHPTQKPLKLIEKLLNIQSKENDIILDCFSGSGTTAIACHNLKRNFICIEKDYDYWKASVERYENAKAQQKLF